MNLRKYEDEYYNYLYNRGVQLYKTYKAVEVRKGHYIINIPMKRTIIGHINGKKNVLNFNFWSTVFSGLCCCNVNNLLDTKNNNLTAQSGKPVATINNIGYGSGTGSASISQYNLENSCGSIGAQASIGTLSDRSRITVYGTLPNNVNCQINEIGLWGYDEDGYPLYYSRVTGSVSPNSAVSYYIDFLEPWVQNFALIQYKFFTGNTVNCITDPSGNCHSFYEIYTQAELIGSENQYTWNPQIYSISQDVVFNTSHYVSNNENSVVDYILGSYTPSQNMIIYTLGLLQYLYDEDNNSYPAFILIFPLQDPITLYSNQENQVSLRLTAD